MILYFQQGSSIIWYKFKIKLGLKRFFNTNERKYYTVNTNAIKKKLEVKLVNIRYNILYYINILYTI